MKLFNKLAASILSLFMFMTMCPITSIIANDITSNITIGSITVPSEVQQGDVNQEVGFNFEINTLTGNPIKEGDSVTLTTNIGELFETAWSSVINNLVIRDSTNSIIAKAEVNETSITIVFTGASVGQTYVAGNVSTGAKLTAKDVGASGGNKVDKVLKIGNASTNVSFTSPSSGGGEGGGGEGDGGDDSGGGGGGVVADPGAVDLDVFWKSAWSINYNSGAWVSLEVNPIGSMDLYGSTTRKTTPTIHDTMFIKDEIPEKGYIDLSSLRIHVAVPTLVTANGNNSYGIKAGDKYAGRGGTQRYTIDRGANNYMTQITQNSNETIESFEARVKASQLTWGVYTASDKTQTLMCNFGRVGDPKSNNGIKYSNFGEKYNNFDINSNPDIFGDNGASGGNVVSYQIEFATYYPDIVGSKYVTNFASLSSFKNNSSTATEKGNYSDGYLIDNGGGTGFSRSGEISIRLIDEDDSTPISNAEFKVMESTSSGLQETGLSGITNKDGRLTLGTMAQGQYVLVQTKTASGYEFNNNTYGPNKNANGDIIGGQLTTSGEFEVKATDNFGFGTIVTNNKKVVDYKVEHYQQNVNDDNYTLVDTDNLKGIYNSNPIVNSKSYEGFVHNANKTTYETSGNKESSTVLNIAADGSLVVKVYYDRNLYSVSYNVQGHGVAPSTQSNVRFDSLISEPSKPSAKGWNFNGWYKDAECTAGMEWDFTTDKVKSDTILYAKWTTGATTYTVEHYKQREDGTFSNVADEIETLNGNTNQNVNAISKGYFDYVFDSSVPGTIITGVIKDDGSLKLKLYYRAYRNVEYDSQGGNYTPISQKIVHGEKASEPSAPTKAGYIFNGWYYEDNQSNNIKWNFNDPVEKNLVLKAEWTKKEFDVSWVNSDTTKGTISPTNTSEKVKFKEFATSNVKVTPITGGDEYTFAGWSYNYLPDGMADLPGNYISGLTLDYKTVSVEGDIVFTAMYTQKSYVNINASNGYVAIEKGSTIPDIPTSITDKKTAAKVEYDSLSSAGESVAIRFENMIHYHLSKIIVSDLYGNSYTIYTNVDGDSKDDIFAMNDSNLDIEFNMDEGSIKIDNVKNSLSIDVKFEEDEKYNVHFYEQTKDKVTSMTKPYASNTGLYSGDAHGIIPAKTPIKEGFTFSGWSYDGINVNYDSTKKITNSNVNVYAIYNQRTYTVNYDLNGGSYLGKAIKSIPALNTVFEGTNLLPSTDPIKSGYQFTGWFISDIKVEATTKYKDLVANDSVDSITLKAEYTANNYQVQFDKNSDSATGSMNNQHFVYDEAQQLNENDFTREGYTFAGWSTQPDGNIVYANSDSVKNLTDVKDDVVTLYAVWIANGDTVYNVEYYKQKSDGTFSDIADEVLTFTGETDTMAYAHLNQYDRFIFDDENEKNILNGNIEADGTLVLKVYYNRIETVSFDVDGGTPSIANQDIVYGKKIVKPSNPSKVDYTFIGWSYLDGNGVEQLWDFDNDVVFSSFTLKAKYEKKAEEIKADTGVQTSDDSNRFQNILILIISSIILGLQLSKRWTKEKSN